MTSYKKGAHVCTWIFNAWNLKFSKWSLEQSNNTEFLPINLHLFSISLSIDFWMDLESFDFMSFLLILVNEFPLAKLFTISLISFSLTSLDWTLPCSVVLNVTWKNNNNKKQQLNVQSRYFGRGSFQTAPDLSKEPFHKWGPMAIWRL